MDKLKDLENRLAALESGIPGCVNHGDVDEGQEGPSLKYALNPLSIGTVGVQPMPSARKPLEPLPKLKSSPKMGMGTTDKLPPSFDQTMDDLCAPSPQANPFARRRLFIAAAVMFLVVVAAGVCVFTLVLTDTEDSSEPVTPVGTAVGVQTILHVAISIISRNWAKQPRMG
jgi:hypothetical protein